MARLIEFVRPSEFSDLTPVLRVRGVKVYVHWSVFLIALLMLLNAGRKPVLTIVGMLSYLSVLLVHETGHLIAAQYRGSRVEGIYLYPIHGRCCFQTPWSRFDHCIIAWGGVIAQAVVAAPLLLWLVFFGYTRFDAINAVLAVLGGFSLCVAVFNLIPAGNLDGRMAWAIIPEYLRRKRNRKSRSAVWR